MVVTGVKTVWLNIRATPDHKYSFIPPQSILLFPALLSYSYMYNLRYS